MDDFLQRRAALIRLGMLAAGAGLAMPAARSSTMPDFGEAPDLAGIQQWHNSQPLNLDSLRGKVVLIDFWTYSCINCIRTLPYVRKWYESYKDQGLVVIGVHTPEFPYEKDVRNVARAIERHKLGYPVAQDNRYATWTNFDNEYWPAVYLIDKQGRIRLKHVGEGHYAETEAAIRTLLAEASR
jgi:thiol-disulfide isomerase/thioredoxin